MFTGIIEEIGSVASSLTRGKGRRFTIQAGLVLEGTKEGDSICINGVCLTVIGIRAGAFDVDCVEETLAKSTLGSLKPQMKVNLERALRPEDRLGGHFVLGHVDCTGSVSKIEQLDTSRLIEIGYPRQFSKYVIPVGSIAVDGVSLTVAKKAADRFTVSIIPHSYKNTIVQEYTQGTRVNLEFDMLGKYVVQMLEHRREGDTLSTDYLAKLGY